MHWIDLLIVTIPTVLVLWMALYSGRYAKGVVDFLATGRAAGRYVISVGDVSSALSVVWLLGTECTPEYGSATERPSPAESLASGSGSA